MTLDRRRAGIVIRLVWAIVAIAAFAYAKPPVLTCDPGYVPECVPAGTPTPTAIPTATRTPTPPGAASMVLYLEGNPASGPYSIEAKVTGATPARVDFTVDGGAYLTEWSAPYCLFGDAPSGSKPCLAKTLGVRSHIVTGRAYSGSNAQIAAASMSVTESGPPPTAIPTPVPTAIPTPIPTVPPASTPTPGGTVDMRLVPDALVFASQPIGGTSPPQNIQLFTVNGGFKIDRVTVGAPFVLTGNACMSDGSGGWDGTLAPNSHCDLWIAFAPTTPGSSTAVALVQAGNTTKSAALSGSAASAPTPTATPGGPTPTVTPTPTRTPILPTPTPLPPGQFQISTCGVDDETKRNLGFAPGQTVWIGSPDSFTGHLCGWWAGPCSKPGYVAGSPGSGVECYIPGATITPKAGAKRKR